MRRCTSSMIIVLSMLSTAAWADDWQLLEQDLAQPTLDIEPGASHYPKRWCPLSYVESSRQFETGSDTRVAFYFPSWIDDQELPTDAPFDADRTSLLSRLEALSSLRLMTLWRGRENALVIGLNRSGYLGISLDEAVASND